MPNYPGWEATLRGKVWRTTHFPRIREDEPTFLGRPHAVKKSDLEGADVVIIGAPFVAGFGRQYSGVDKDEWIESTKRVRQQSIRYRSGYIQDFDLDVFEHLKVVDYGDADIPREASYEGTVEKILEAEAATMKKVNDALDVGAVPIVIGQNSPCGSYAVGKPIADRTKGPVGMVSLDTHWDAWPFDWATMSPHVAGSTNWKDKLYRDCPNLEMAKLVEIGERGMLEDPSTIRRFVGAGASFIPMWKLRTELGIEGCVRALDKAFTGTDAVYCHFDMDVLGGAGPAEGDILGELAEPIGMTDYEAIRLGHECGRRNAKGLSFICIPPGSAVVYRVIVYVIMYFMAGLALHRIGKRT